MKPLPDFSVIVPCFQPGALILDSIASIMEQRLPPEWEAPEIEVIVIDDHSQDQATRAALIELEQRHPGIRVLHNEDNLGVSATRNRGIAEASGRWIKFLDADDFWMAGHLERTIGAMTRFPEAVWFAGDHAKTDFEGKTLPVITRNPLIAAALQESGNPVMEFDDARRAAIHSFLCHVDTVTIRAEALTAVGGFNPELRSAEDHDLWLRLACRHPLVYIKGELAGYRTTPASVTTSMKIPHPHLGKALQSRLSDPAYSDLAPLIRMRLIEIALSNIYHYRRFSLFAEAATEAKAALSWIPWSGRLWKMWFAAMLKR